MLGHAPLSQLPLSTLPSASAPETITCDKWISEPVQTNHRLKINVAFIATVICAEALQPIPTPAAQQPVQPPVSEPVKRSLRTSWAPDSVTPEMGIKIPSMDSWYSPLTEPANRRLKFARAESIVPELGIKIPSSDGWSSKLEEPLRKLRKVSALSIFETEKALGQAVPPLDSWGYTSTQFFLKSSAARVPISVTPVAPTTTTTVIPFDWDNPLSVTNNRNLKRGRSEFSVTPEVGAKIPSMDSWYTTLSEPSNRKLCLSKAQTVIPELGIKIPSSDSWNSVLTEPANRKLKANRTETVFETEKALAVGVSPLDSWGYTSTQFTLKTSSVRVPISVTPVAPTIVPPAATYEDAWTTKLAEPQNRTLRRSRSGAQVAASKDELYAIIDGLQPVNEPRRIHKYFSVIPTIFETEKAIPPTSADKQPFFPALAEPVNRKLKLSKSPFSVTPEVGAKIPPMDSWYVPLSVPNNRALKLSQKQFSFETEKGIAVPAPSMDSWSSVLSEPSNRKLKTSIAVNAVPKLGIKIPNVESWVFPVSEPIKRSLKLSRSAFSVTPEVGVAIPNVESWMPPVQAPIKRALKLGRSDFSMRTELAITIFPPVDVINMKLYLSKDMHGLKFYLGRDLTISPRI